MLSENMNGINGNAVETVKSALKTVKHSAGQVVRLPGQIAEGVGKVAEGAGGAVKGVGIALPVTLVVIGIGIAAYLLFSGKKGVNLLPVHSPVIPPSVELMGRVYRKKRR